MSKRKEGETGDQETDDIIADMEKNGEGNPFKSVSDDEDDAEDSDEDEDEEDEEDSEDDEDEDEDSDEDDDEEDSDDDEDSEEDKDEESEDDEDEDDDEDESEADDDDEDEDSDEDDKEEGDKPQGRTPVWQRLRDEKKARKEAQTEIADLKQQLENGGKAKDIDTMAGEFAKKHGFKVEAAKDLLEAAAALAAQKSGLDPKTKKALEAVVQRDSETTYWKGQEKQFVREFNSTIAPLAQRDGVNPKKAMRILREQVFKPENEKKSTVQLYLEHVAKATTTKKGKITVESGRRRVHTTAAKQIDELSATDISDMSDKEFEALSEGLGKASKSKITRR